MPSRGPLIPTFTFDAWFFMQLTAVLFSKINVMSQQSRGDTFDVWPFSHGDDICEGRGDVRCVDILLERNLIKINIFIKLKSSNYIIIALTSTSVLKSDQTLVFQWIT